jgi:hypothetical protein
MTYRTSDAEGSIYKKRPLLRAEQAHAREEMQCIASTAACNEGKQTHGKRTAEVRTKKRPDRESEARLSAKQRDRPPQFNEHGREVFESESDGDSATEESGVRGRERQFQALARALHDALLKEGYSNIVGQLNVSLKLPKVCKLHHVY